MMLNEIIIGSCSTIDMVNLFRAYINGCVLKGQILSRALIFPQNRYFAFQLALKNEALNQTFGRTFARKNIKNRLHLQISEMHLYLFFVKLMVFMNFTFGDLIGFNRFTNTIR